MFNLIFIKRVKLLLFIFVFTLPCLAATQVSNSDQQTELTYRYSLKLKRELIDIEIHYERRLAHLLKRVVKIVEEKLPVLVNYFDTIPNDTIHLYLRPDTTVANGSATVLPRNFIQLYNQPGFYFGHLAQNANWLELLIVHELAHILHLDKTEGVLDVLRKIFGSIGKLGGVTPRWFTEGIGVWTESEYTHGGRLKTDLFRFEVESAFLNKDFCSRVDCIDHPGVYPHASSPYWVGGYFMSYLEKQKKGTVSCLVDANSDSIPFFLNDAFNECTGVGVKQNFYIFRKKLIKNISKKSKRIHRKLKNNGFKALSPSGEAFVFSKNFRVQNQKLEVVESKDFLKRVSSYDLSSGSLIEKKHTEYFSVSLEPDFDVLRRSGDLNADLIWKDANTWFNPRELKAIKRFKKKDKNFSLNPQYVFKYKGKYYIFSYLNEHLELFRSNGENLVKLKRFKRHFTFTTPYQIGDYIYFKTFNGKKDQLARFSLKTKKINFMQTSRKLNLVGSCHNKLIITDNNQAYTISNQTRSKISNSLMSGVILMRADNSHVALIHKDAPGKIYYKKTNCGSWIGDTSSVSKNVKTLSPKKKLASIKNKNIENYLAFRHLLPNFWFFDFSFGEYLTRLSIYTEIQDPLSHHHFSLAGNLYMEESEFTPSLSYLYSLDDWSFFIAHARYLSKSSITTILNDEKFSKLGIAYLYSKNEFSFSPRLYVAKEDFTDFISKRETNSIHLDSNLVYKGLFKDSFLSLSTWNFDLYYNDVEARVSHYGVEAYQNTVFKPSANTSLRLRGSYGYLDKSDLGSGAIFGGGHSIGKHLFYGVPYSDIFGNEISTGKLEFSFRFLKPYKGPGMFPFFLRELHLLGGHDWVKSQRVFFKSFLYRNKNLASYYVGARGNLDLFYIANLHVDIILANAYDPDLSSNSESSVLVAINGEFL